MNIANLQRGDVGLLIRIFYLLAKIELLRRWLRLPALLRSFDASGSAVRMINLERTVRCTNLVVQRTHGRRSCMTKSLILFCLLTRARLDVSFHIGVTARQSALVSHAWVNLNGQAFGERSDPSNRYRTIFSYTPRGPSVAG